VTIDNVEFVPWPEDAIQEGYYVETEDFDIMTEFKDTFVRRGLTKGEPIITAKLFKRDTPGFMSGVLKPGMRAVTIPVDVVAGGSGFILPGDRVDLILTHGLEIDEEKEGAVVSLVPYLNSPVKLSRTSGTFMRNMLVLAIDQQTAEIEGLAQVAKTVVVEATPKQVEVISTAREMGKISLSLRSIIPDEGEKEALTSSDGLTTEDLSEESFVTNIEASSFFRYIDGVYKARFAEMKNTLSGFQNPQPSSGAPRKQKSGIKVYRGGGGAAPEEIGGDENAAQK